MVLRCTVFQVELFCLKDFCMVVRCTVFQVELFCLKDFCMVLRCTVFQVELFCLTMNPMSIKHPTKIDKTNN